MNMLYKRSTKGAVQVWWMECEENRYRTIHGQEGGKLITSEWVVVAGKNLGKANETTPTQQALAEVKALYKKKREQSGYFDRLDEVDEDRGFFEPMLAHPYDPKRMPTGEAFYVQPKFNGVRCIATAYGLFSRKGKQFHNLPHIEQALQSFFKKYPLATLDGELYNHEYRRDFEKLVSSIKKQKPTPESLELAKQVVEYHIYDYIPTQDYQPSFGMRRNALLTLGACILDVGPIKLAATECSNSLKAIPQCHAANIENGYEGTMIRLDRPYENKRTYSLMKYKDFKDEEFLIVDVQEGKGNWSGVAKIITLRLPDGRTFGAGFKGNRESARRFLELRDHAIGRSGTVVFFDYTADGIPLFPIFTGVRDYE